MLIKEKKRLDNEYTGNKENGALSGGELKRRRFREEENIREDEDSLHAQSAKQCPSSLLLLFTNIYVFFFPKCRTPRQEGKGCEW